MPTGTIYTFDSGEDLEVEWTIQHFFTLQRTDGVYYISPAFSFSGKWWYLWIYPNGSSRHNSFGHVDLALLKCSSGVSMNQCFSLSLKIAKWKKYKEQYYTEDFGDRYSFHSIIRFISREELTKRKDDLVPNDVLTVVCTMKRPTPAGETCAPGCSAIPHQNNLHYDLKQLFLQKEDCDVTFKVGNLEIPAHRLILKARSPVFASTFRHDMKENATGIIEIEDCEPSTFSDFLCFLYCGDAGIISLENVFGLFTAADKYQVLNLRTKCLKFMRKNLSVDTFCETVTLALRHSEAELIGLCTEYFKQNVPQVIVTVKWQTFLAENPAESNELLAKYFVPNSS